jgi:hypothetical protein
MSKLLTVRKEKGQNRRQVIEQKENAIKVESKEIEIESPASLEHLFVGNATAKLLDFMLIFKEFDYSETDIAKNAGVSLKTMFRDIPKLEELEIIINTRKVGRAKMYRINSQSPVTKALEEFSFQMASKRADLQ